jgi:hypothetical protein
MNPTPTSPKTKWLLGLLAAVGALVLLSPLLLMVARAVSKPQVMQVSTPAKAPRAPAGAPAEALTILLGSGRQLYYYFGTATPASAASLRVVAPGPPLRQVIKAWQQQHRATVFIKPGAPDNYKALVDILDEMNIDGQRSYAVVAATDADRQLLPPSERQ